MEYCFISNILTNDWPVLNNFIQSNHFSFFFNTISYLFNTILVIMLFPCFILIKNNSELNKKPIIILFLTY